MSEPTFIQHFEDWTLATLERARRLGTERSGRYGMHQSGKRVYWVAAPFHDLYDALCGNQDAEIAEGFAGSRALAFEDLSAAIRQRWPTDYVFHLAAKHASTLYRARYAKAGRFRNDWRERFPFWRNRTVLHEWGPGEEHDFWNAVPIVAVTDKWVYVPRERGSRDMVSPDRIARRDCRALPRLKLENDGNTLGRGWWQCFYVERPQQRQMSEAGQAADPARIAELRRVMQREHPDRGGDVEAFRSAQREYEALRGRARARIHLSRPS